MEQEIIYKKYFKIRFCSDLDYEGMVVDIVYKNNTLLTLYLDKGVDNIEIKLYAPQKNEFWDFPYNEFIDVLEKAKNELIRINKN